MCLPILSSQIQISLTSIIHITFRFHMWFNLSSFIRIQKSFKRIHRKLFVHQIFLFPISKSQTNRLLSVTARFACLMKYSSPCSNCAYGEFKIWEFLSDFHYSISPVLCALGVAYVVNAIYAYDLWITYGISVSGVDNRTKAVDVFLNPRSD